MKRAFVACLVVGIAAYATGAWSASPISPTEKQLLTRVTKLENQVKSLQTQVKNVTVTTSTGLGAVALIAVCSDLIAADELQGTWQVLDQVSSATQAGKTYFGLQAPIALTVGGQDLCQGLGVSRSQVVPPSIAPFQALLGGFTSTGLAPSGLKLG